MALAAYIHVPFCRHRCGYCNFTLVADRDDLIDDYLKALERELQQLHEPRPVDTLFFGGGTPSHLPPPQLARLLTIARLVSATPGRREISLEANPDDIDADRIAVLRAAGVTRISLGAQSWQADKLRRLDRHHTASSVERAIEQLQAANFVIGIDLIFAAPDESLDEWQTDLARTIAWRPHHVSTYGLTWERGTRFGAQKDKQLLASIEEELEAQMYEKAIDTLTAHGWEHYEVSNFALPHYRCRHNEAYWLGDEYFAAGPGAARYLAGERSMNHRSTTTYLRRVLRGESPIAERETLAPEHRARERLVFAMRRLDGIDEHEFAQQTGFSLTQLVGSLIDDYCERGLLERINTRLRLTRRGLLVSDAIWSRFLTYNSHLV